MSTKYIEKQFEANLWANVNLVSLCATLNGEQLSVEVEGIFGRIRTLITHIIQGEGNYLRDLAGSNPWSADLDWDALSLTQLAEMAQQSGSALLDSVGRFDPEHVIHYEDDEETAEFKAWVVTNQAILHGIEHRTQIHAMLTKAGVSHPDQSVWSYGKSVGALKIEMK